MPFRIFFGNTSGVGALRLGKSVPDTLLAAQKTGAGQALARATLADNGHLHLSAQHTPTDGGHVCGVNTGSSIVRIRRAASLNVQYQIVTDPTAAAEWNTWTDITGATPAVPDKGTLFYTGTYLVAVWQDNTDADVKYSRSSDGGLTWSAPAVAYALAAAAFFGGVSGGATRSGLFLSYGGQLYWGAYDPAADTWTAVDSAALATTSITSIAAAWDADNSRHILAIAAAGLATGLSFPVILLTRSAAGAWSTPHIQYAIASLNQLYTGLAISQDKVSGFWWLSALRVGDWTDSEYGLACSDDGLEWEDLNFQAATDDSGLLQVLGTLAGSVWVASRAHVWKNVPQVFWSNRTLRSYEIDCTGDMGRLVGELVNQDGAITAAPPERWAVLTLERGLQVAGVDYYISAGVFHLTGFHFMLQNNVVAFSAIDAVGLLTRWESDQAYTWTGETLQQLVRFVCALAGVHVVAFDSAAIWSDTLPFIIHPSSSGLAALDSLAARGNFDVLAQEDGSLYCFVAAAAPAAQHTYGDADGQHRYWPGAFGEGLAPNYVAVYPDDEANSDAEMDTADMADMGHRQVDAFIDRRLLAGADVAELAAARMLLAKEQRRTGFFDAPCNFALEPSDILAFGANYESGFTWRCTGFIERYGMRKERPFFQHVVLRGTA